MRGLLILRAVAAGAFAAAILLIPARAAAAPFAFVTNEADDTVSVVDLASLTVVDTLEVGRDPRAVTISPDGATAYIGTADGVTEIAVATRTVLGTTPSWPLKNLAVSPSGRRLYATTNAYTRDDQSFVYVFGTDPMAVLGQIAFRDKDERQRDLVVSADERTLYVASELESVRGDELIAIDLPSRAVDWQIVTGNGAVGVAALGDTSRIYVAGYKSHEVAVIDTAARSRLSLIRVGLAPKYVALDPAEEYLYVANSGTDDVTVISTASNVPVADIPVCNTPLGIAVGPFGQRVYVACYDSDLLAVIDTTSRTVVATVAVGHHPQALGDFVTPAAGITAEPGFVDFGSVDVGAASSTERVIVRNVGDTTLSVTDALSLGTHHADFEIADDRCTGRTLGAGELCPVFVRFRPTDHGFREGQLSIRSDALGTPDLRVPLRGTGLAPDIRISGALDPIEGLILQLGTAEVGETTRHGRTVLNTGNRPLSIGTIGGSDPLAAPFAIDADECSGTDVAPGEACTFDLLFAPTGGGSASDSFDLPSNDPDEGDLSIGVRGSGSTEPVGRLFVIDGDEPRDDGRTSFGDVAIGDSVALDFALTNLGSRGALEVTAVRIAGEGADAFALAMGDGTERSCGSMPVTVPGPPSPLIPTYSACDFQVTFASTEGRLYEAQLEVDSNDPDQPTYVVELGGTGLAGRLAAPETLDLGEVPVGRGNVDAITLTNAGTAPLVMEALVLSGEGFTLDPAGGVLGCGEPPVTLEADRSCTVAVALEAAEVRLYEGSLEIYSDDPARPSVAIALRGEGVEEARPDGGVDAGPGDGGVGDAGGADGGGAGGGGGGCGCRIEGASAQPGPAVAGSFFLALLVALGLAVRRRRRDGGPRR